MCVTHLPFLKSLKREWKVAPHVLQQSLHVLLEESQERMEREPQESEGVGREVVKMEESQERMESEATSEVQKEVSVPNEESQERMEREHL